MRPIDADGLEREICRDQCEKDGCGSHCELIGYVENAPTIGGWISVKDRLPEPVPDEYLVVNGGKVQLAIFMDGMWITPHRVSSITHWMPLPEPPEEEP